MFRPIARAKNVDVFVQAIAQKVLIGLSNQYIPQLRDLRCASRVDNVFINYFEVWQDAGGGADFFLDKAYMHLDVPFPDGSGDEEVLALHCDPQTPKADPSFLYKRGPHFHISGNKRDISKSHIGLCITHEDQACGSIDALTTAFSEIISMIDRELLPRLAQR
jgi:hypothetical protein